MDFATVTSGAASAGALCGPGRTVSTSHVSCFQLLGGTQSVMLTASKVLQPNASAANTAPPYLVTQLRKSAGGTIFLSNYASRKQAIMMALGSQHPCTSTSGREVTATGRLHPFPKFIAHPKQQQRSIFELDCCKKTRRETKRYIQNKSLGEI